MTDDLEQHFLTERITFVAKAGTQETITAYLEQYPGVWNNISNFIRAALSCYIIEQRKIGRHVTKRTEAKR